MYCNFHEFRVLFAHTQQLSVGRHICLKKYQSRNDAYLAYNKIDEKGLSAQIEN